MSDLVLPNIPSVVIKIIPNLGLTVSGPEDRMLILGMLSLATAMIQREIMQPAQLPSFGNGNPSCT